mgnify:CR=1 FL=1
MTHEASITPITADAPDLTTPAGRIRAILGESQPDLSDYLAEGGQPLSCLVLEAVEEAREAIEMLGCAFSGAGVHFGGEPSPYIASRWIELTERKAKIAHALAKAALEGGRHE